MKLYRWILMDLDNTIFDFSASSHLAFCAFLKDFEIPEKEEYYHIYKKVNAEVWKKLETGEINSDEVKWSRFFKFFKAIEVDKDPHQANECYLDHLVDNFRFIHKAEETINYLGAHYQLAAVTNGLKQVQRPRLHRSGIGNAFKVIVVSEEVGHAKPQKAFFDIVFSEMGNPLKNDVLIIGDNLSSDIKGGIEYGIDTCWFNHENIDNQTTFKPHYEVSSMDGIRSIL